MLILSLLTVVIAQQIIKSPAPIAAPFIESGAYSVVCSGSATITFQFAQPDTLFKLIFYV